MNTQELSNKIQEIASILHSSGFAGEASRVQRLLDFVISGDLNRNEYLSEIEGLCGVKSFGDLYVSGIDDKAWLKLLSEARMLARER